MVNFFKIMSREEAMLLLRKEEAQLLSEESEMAASAKRETYKTERDQFILCIYDYWKAKRLKFVILGLKNLQMSCFWRGFNARFSPQKHPLTPIVLTDKSGVATQQNNPYLVFRRRTEKMQTRKNRKNEEQSYEKMLILKRDLCRAQ